MAEGVQQGPVMVGTFFKTKRLAATRAVKKTPQRVPKKQTQTGTHLVRRASSGLTPKTFNKRERDQLTGKMS